MLVRDGEDDEREQDGDEHDGRRQDEDGLVGEGRYPVLLGEDLDRVGEDLQQARRPDAVGTVAVLPDAQQAALHPDQPGGDRERHDQHPEDDQELPEPLRHGRSSRASGRRARRTSAAPRTEGRRGPPAGRPRRGRGRRRGAAAGAARPIGRATVEGIAGEEAGRLGLGRAEGDVGLGGAFGDAGRVPAERLGAVDVVEGDEQPLALARHEGRRDAVGGEEAPAAPRGVPSAREQTHATRPAVQRPVRLLLELGHAVHRVPAGTPDVRQQRRRDQRPVHAFEREGERRIEVLDRRRLLDGAVGILRRATAEADGLARDAAPGEAEAGAGGRVARPRELGQFLGQGREHLVDRGPGAALGAVEPDEQLAQPAPGVADLVAGREDGEEALRAPLGADVRARGLGPRACGEHGGRSASSCRRRSRTAPRCARSGRRTRRPAPPRRDGRGRCRARAPCRPYPRRRPRTPRRGDGRRAGRGRGCWARAARAGDAPALPAPRRAGPRRAAEPRCRRSRRRPRRRRSTPPRSPAMSAAAWVSGSRRRRRARRRRGRRRPPPPRRARARGRRARRAASGRPARRAWSRAAPGGGASWVRGA